MFISYDDPHTCQGKVSYARNHSLGGVMIWELAQDHLSGQPDVLLETVKQAFASPGELTIHRTNTNIALNFNAIALGSYRILWSGALGNPWNTLAITNLSGPGQVLQIVDTNPPTQSPKFYRVQSPQ